MSSSSAPSLPAPSGRCDCHVHVFDPARFPFAEDRAYTPASATTSQLAQAQQPTGTDRVVIVQPSVYGTDNACLMDALARIGGERARGVAVVDLDRVPDEELQRLHAGGVRGVRLNLNVMGADLVAARQAVRAANRIAAIPGWHLQLHADMTLIVALLPALEQLGIPVALDHFAGGATDSAESQRTLGELLRAGHDLPLYVKLSAPYRLPPEASADALAHAFYQAWPDRVLWGSDWPHTGGSGGHGRTRDAVEPFRSVDSALLLQQLIAALNDKDAAQRLLIDNPAALYGFTS